MSRAHMLVSDERPDVPRDAQWWTLPLRSDEVVRIDLDDPDTPAVATYTFDDGHDADITPVAIRTRHEPDRANLGRDYTRVAPGRSYLDVLVAGRPSPSDRWLELTQPGGHWHPNDGKPPYDVWAADTIRQSDVARGLRRVRAFERHRAR